MSIFSRQNPGFRHLNKQLTDFTKITLLNENHEKSKHQKTNLKQIPMTQIQNSKQIIPIQSCPAAPSPAEPGLRSDAIRLW
jgi:hypothetical protein